MPTRMRVCVLVYDFDAAQTLSMVCRRTHRLLSGVRRTVWMRGHDTTTRRACASLPQWPTVHWPMHGCEPLEELHIARADDPGLWLLQEHPILLPCLRTLRIIQDMTTNHGLSEHGLLGVRRLMIGAPQLRNLHLTVAMQPLSG